MEAQSNLSSNKIYCKKCRRECIKLLSQSSPNPGREYYSCPIPRVNGGHGWMHWADDNASIKTEVRYMKPGDVLQATKDQLVLCEAKLELLEDTLQLEREKLKVVKGEMEKTKDENNREKMKTKCLMKILKGVLVIVFIWLICGSLFRRQ